MPGCESEIFRFRSFLKDNKRLRHNPGGGLFLPSVRSIEVREEPSYDVEDALRRVGQVGRGIAAGMNTGVYRGGSMVSIIETEKDDARDAVVVVWPPRWYFGCAIVWQGVPIA